MRKIFNLIILVVLTAQGVLGQVLPDKNWDGVNLLFSDEFNTPLSNFRPNYVDAPNRKWRAYFQELECVLAKDDGGQVFQRSQCRFSPLEGTGLFRIVCDYAGHEIQQSDVECPTSISGNACTLPAGGHYYYYSGAIETRKRIQYGYIEMRCKLPIHKEAFPAFWLWGAQNNHVNDNYYEEIDIFEWTRKVEGVYTSDSIDAVGRRYYAGIWCNPHHGTYDPDTSDTTNRGAQYVGNSMIHVPDNGPLLNDWNVFGCEWSPGFVRWFLNGKLQNTYAMPDTIPQHPMTLKINYTIKGKAIVLDPVTHMPDWQDGDEMVIDYVRVYKLKRDCESIAYITTLSALQNFNFALKKEIHICPITHLSITSGQGDTFRATQKIRLKNVTIPQGSKVSFIMQDCSHAEAIVD